jgi:DNA-binding HxlR family transcriptional regulator
MLTKQLRELEDAGLVNRVVYAEVPPRVEYSLTPLGESLKPIIVALRNWGTNYLAAKPAPAARKAA